MDWNRAVFLHTGWTSHYNGSEAPEGGHAYLRKAVGVEALNFKPNGGFCFGYAPVSKISKGGGTGDIPKGDRTLNITKLGAAPHLDAVEGITVIWTARRPYHSPVIVGVYEDATVYRFMQQTPAGQHFIAKARADDCHLVPDARRDFIVQQKMKGFPGQAAAWFPGLHQDGPAHDFLVKAADYVQSICR